MIDFMVMEAVALKVAKQDDKERKDAERKAKVKEERERLKEAVR